MTTINQTIKKAGTKNRKQKQTKFGLFLFCFPFTLCLLVIKTKTKSAPWFMIKKNQIRKRKRQRQGIRKTTKRLWGMTMADIKLTWTKCKRMNEISECVILRVKPTTKNYRVWCVLYRTLPVYFTPRVNMCAECSMWRLWATLETVNHP